MSAWATGSASVIKDIIGAFTCYTGSKNNGVQYVDAMFNGQGVALDAKRSNKLYSMSTTVQPSSLRVKTVVRT